jgi:methylphosphotriester-DNA--protein-cysteine methyltransferase
MPVVFRFPWYAADTSGSKAAPARGTRHEGKRVFFAVEAAAVAAGYRPCGNCMREA